MKTHSCDKTAIHVLPIQDEGEHEIQSTCPCGCDVGFEDGEMIIVHSSWDKREILEALGLVGAGWVAVRFGE